MKMSLCLLALVGWGVVSIQGQSVGRVPAQTNAPPLKLQPSVMLRAPPQHKSSHLLSTNLHTGGLMVKLATRADPLQAINPLAPLPALSDYVDLTFDPMPVEHRGLVLFWISF